MQQIYDINSVEGKVYIIERLCMFIRMINALRNTIVETLHLKPQTLCCYKVDIPVFNQ